MILSPTFIPFLGVADDGAATHAGFLLLRAPAHVGEAFAFAVGHGVVARAGAARRDKAVLRRVGEGAILRAILSWPLNVNREMLHVEPIFCIR